MSTRISFLDFKNYTKARAHVRKKSTISCWGTLAKHFKLKDQIIKTVHFFPMHCAQGIEHNKKLPIRAFIRQAKASFFKNEFQQIGFRIGTWAHHTARASLMGKPKRAWEIPLKPKGWAIYFPVLSANVQITND